jgi:hypothetical protein
MTSIEPFLRKNFRLTSRTGDRTFSASRMFSATYHPQILTCRRYSSNQIMTDPRPDEWTRRSKDTSYHYVTPLFVIQRREWPTATSLSLRPNFPHPLEGLGGGGVRVEGTCVAINLHIC